MLGWNGLALVPLLCSLAGAAQRGSALHVNITAGHCPLTPVLMSDSPGRMSKQPIPMPAPASHTQGSVVHLSDTW